MKPSTSGAGGRREQGPAQLAHERGDLARVEPLVGLAAARESTCTGTIVLRTLKAVTAGARQTHAPAVLTLAAGSFSISGGDTDAITLRVSKKSRALLARTHLLRARATITAHDPAGASHVTRSILTIRPAKATHGH